VRFIDTGSHSDLFNWICIWIIANIRPAWFSINVTLGCTLSYPLVNSTNASNK
jgi:hypothetical protein